MAKISVNKLHIKIGFVCIREMILQYILSWNSMQEPKQDNGVTSEYPTPFTCIAVL